MSRASPVCADWADEAIVEADAFAVGRDLGGHRSGLGQMPILAVRSAKAPAPRLLLIRLPA